jgi:non-canonical purine NTP pyrophosphatase (RdgB/HAM1 family)
MLTLVTSNPNKKAEVEEILNDVHFDSAALELPEIQSMNLREVVEAKVKAAYATLKRPVVIEDVSLELEALNGFPGPFVKWWKQVVGYELAVRIAKEDSKYGAIAKCGAAYHDGERFTYAEGVCRGRLVAKAGESGFGFDPYFVPEGHEKTFAQMSREAKNGISHRARAWKGLRDELKGLGII